MPAKEDYKHHIFTPDNTFTTLMTETITYITFLGFLMYRLFSLINLHI